MDKTDVLIIGAGVIGLAVAAELSRQLDKKADIVLMEQYHTYGQETSGRNSEVIHAGIYYPAGSLKAALCVEGKELLYHFCRQWNVAYAQTGKIIVARQREETAQLESLLQRARENGVDDLVLLEKSDLSRLEPNVRAEAGLLSPSTGIVDSHGLMQRLEQLAWQQGVFIAYCHTVTGIERLSDGFKVFFSNPDGSHDSICCEWLINSAGLSSSRVAQWAGVDTGKAGYTLFPCKGEYFSLPYGQGQLVSRLIYPPHLEELQGLGIHLTKALDGRARLGPNAIYVKEIDYNVNPEHAAEFYHGARTYLPFLQEEDLVPEMAGIRPKLQGPADSFRDFVIADEEKRGIKGLLSLVGIESPGLTCCLSIARMAARLVKG